MTKLPKRTSNTCMKTIHIGKNTYTHNIQSELLIITLFSFFLAVSIGFFQETVNSKLDEIYGIDFWSIAHFMFGLGFFTLGLLLFKKNTISFIFAIIITSIWEIIEYILGFLGFYESVFVEIISNQWMDIIFNISGILLGYYLYRNRICFEKE